MSRIERIRIKKFKKREWGDSLDCIEIKKLAWCGLKEHGSLSNLKKEKVEG